MPAQAGIQYLDGNNLDSRFRGNDTYAVPTGGEGLVAIVLATVGGERCQNTK